MRIENLLKSAASVVCIIIASCLSGCTIIGAATGSAIDNSQSDSRFMDGWECGNIDGGTGVTIHMKDGSLYNALYTGTDTLSTNEYTRLFEESLRRKPADINCPALGDTLRMVDNGGDQASYAFCGFSYGYSPPAGRSGKGGGCGIFYLRARPIDDQGESELRLDLINKMIDSSGRIFKRKELEGLVMHGLMPLKTVMTAEIFDSRLLTRKRRYSFDVHRESDDVIAACSSPMIFSIESIDSIEVPRKKCGKWIGLGLGAAVDAAIVIAFFVTRPFLSWGSH
jgi:hypothetical protein